MKRILTTLKEKWPEYLLEILVLIIGIYGAFAVDNWNDSRKDRERENAILGQLETEFESNLDQLDQKIEIRNKMLNAAVLLLGYIDDPESRNIDSANLYIAWTIPYTTFDPIVNDLASSGSLRIIQSDSLKQMLSIWTSQIVQVSESEDIWTKFRNELHVPFLIKHYQLRTMRNNVMKTNLMRSFLIDQLDMSNTYRISKIGDSKHKSDLEHLLNQPDFEDHLVRLITNNRVTQQQSLILRLRMKEILELIKYELKE